MSNTRNLFDDEGFYSDFEDEYAEETVVKKCHCGYRGSLTPDPDGYRCPECSWLVIDNHKRK